MNDVALQKQIDEIFRELKISGETMRDQMVQLRAELDQCRLEMDALREFLKTAYPALSRQFAQFMEKHKREVDPERK